MTNVLMTHTPEDVNELQYVSPQRYVFLLLRWVIQMKSPKTCASLSSYIFLEISGNNSLQAVQN